MDVSVRQWGSKAVHRYGDAGDRAHVAIGTREAGSP